MDRISLRTCLRFASSAALASLLNAALTCNIGTVGTRNEQQHLTDRPISPLLYDITYSIPSPFFAPSEPQSLISMGQMINPGTLFFARGRMIGFYHFFGDEILLQAQGMMTGIGVSNKLTDGDLRLRRSTSPTVHLCLVNLHLRRPTSPRVHFVLSTYISDGPLGLVHDHNSARLSQDELQGQGEVPRDLPPFVPL